MFKTSTYIYPQVVNRAFLAGPVVISLSHRLCSSPLILTRRNIFLKVKGS